MTCRSAWGSRSVQQRLQLVKVCELLIAAALNEQHRRRYALEMADGVIQQDAPPRGIDVEHRALHIAPVLARQGKRKNLPAH